MAKSGPASFAASKGKVAFLSIQRSEVQHGCSKGGELVLMVKKSGDHQLRLVVYPMFTRFYTSQVVVWDFFHQQYERLYFSILRPPHHHHHESSIMVVNMFPKQATRHQTCSHIKRGPKKGCMKKLENNEHQQKFLILRPHLSAF